MYSIVVTTFSSDIYGEEFQVDWVFLTKADAERYIEDELNDYERDKIEIRHISLYRPKIRKGDLLQAIKKTFFALEGEGFEVVSNHGGRIDIKSIDRNRTTISVPEDSFYDEFRLV